MLVIGDVILDEYLIGQATRMSREAPVPVLEFESRRLIPGGAANPAVNIAALGAQALQVGVIGADDFGTQLCDLLNGHHINTDGIVTDPDRPTTVKTRIMAQMGLRFPQQVARLDRLSRDPVPQEIEGQLCAFVETHLDKIDALLFSDYHGGLLTSSLINQLRDKAEGHLLTADAQGELDKYVGFHVVKCNADEARKALERPLHSDADFAQAATELREKLNLQGGMVITRGGDGATVSQADGKTFHSPAPAVTDVYDTVGAGDTAIAVLTLALSAGGDYAQAAALANYASGLVVRRVGNYAPSADELRQAVTLT